MKLFVLLLLTILSDSQDINTIFQESNEYYTNGKYQNAVNGYQNIIDLGFESAELYFNLGNTYYKLNNIPESNYYYEKAKVLSPNDKDISTNLIFAQNLRIDKIERLPVTQIQNFKLIFLDVFTERGWSILFIIIIWSLCSAFVLYLLLKDPKFKRLFFSLSIVFLIFSSLILYLSFEKKELNDTKYAIIYDKEIEVWSEPNKISELKFLLHEGTKVKQIDMIEDWVSIQLENGTLGWIKFSGIKLLN